MISDKSIMADRNLMLQRFVHVSRKIIERSAENKSIHPDVWTKLKSLVVESDKLGIHGTASSGISCITIENNKNNQ